MLSDPTLLLATARPMASLPLADSIQLAQAYQPTADVPILLLIAYASHIGTHLDSPTFSQRVAASALTPAERTKALHGYLLLKEIQLLADGQTLAPAIASNFSVGAVLYQVPSSGYNKHNFFSGCDQVITSLTPNQCTLEDGNQIALNAVSKSFYIGR